MAGYRGGADRLLRLRQLAGDPARGGLGAGRKFAPIATGDHKAPAAKEGFVSFLLLSLSVAIVIGVVIVIIGL